MILFHGSNTDILRIDLSKCKPYKDFGKGFYLTTIRDQAERMAVRVARMFGGTPIVNVYEFDNSIMSKNILNIKVFPNPTPEWAEFVITNRNYERLSSIPKDNNCDNRYDIVSGPVANDDLALLFRQFSDGLISSVTLLEALKYKKLTDQYSFHTERSLSYLKKTGKYNV